MNTISLTDEAYQRLQDWKEAHSDSFSTVVLTVVPRKETKRKTIERVVPSPVTRKTAFMSV